MPTNDDLIAEFMAAGDELPAQPQGIFNPDFVPNLNPIQLDIFNDDDSSFILAFGERGSGKSQGVIHKLVKHCVNNYNALAVIIVGVKRQALESGIWSRLITDILPEWKRGAGIDYTESKSNVAKDEYIFVTNKFGGWSRILLLSMPVPAHIKDRAKGMEFSCVCVDEIQTLNSDEYFSVIVQQLGRKAHIQGKQQYLATCNPIGKSSWQYARWFIKPLDKETGEYNKLYKHYHVPISENIHNLPPGYYDNVMEAVKDDPIEYRRMVLGEWIDRPTGDAIFATEFNPLIHIKGDEKTGSRILPSPKFPIWIGYDLGTANSAVVFMQNLETRDASVWTIFDEMVYTDAHVSYPDLVPGIFRRMKFWQETSHSKFEYIHISDSSAFNQFRATHGTFDALEVQRLSEELVKDFTELKPIHLIECPKPQHSVSARVRLTKKLLSQDRLFISDSCRRVKQTFNFLESEKLGEKKYDPSLPFTPKRSEHLHAFDALSYVLFYAELDTARQYLKSGIAKPQLLRIGGG